VKTIDLLHKAFLFISAVALCLVVSDASAQQQNSNASAQQQNQDEEVQLGQEVFNELKAKGEIIESSPLYDQLKPFADAITRAAQPRYNHPFKFYLVHETQPNAFATPGGNVYVVDSLLYFVKNSEELAGTLCHEVSHTIHRDTVTLMEKDEKLEKREIGAAILLGPTRAHLLAILLLGKLHSLSYSRDVESRLTSLAPTYVPAPDTTHGDSYGCSRISTMPRWDRSRKSCPITPATKPGSMHWKSTSARIRRCSQSSMPTRIRRRRLLFQRMLRKFSCTRE
jgi:hypothetical protein